MVAYWSVAGNEYLRKRLFPKWQKKGNTSSFVLVGRVDSIRSYFDFIHKIEMTMRAFRALL